MEWWHETHRVSHDESQDSRGQRYAELHKKPSAKTRKVCAEGESLYLGKGFSKNTSPTEPAYKLL